MFGVLCWQVLIINNKPIQLNSHFWQYQEFYIQRMWTLTKPKKWLFFVYESKQDYYDGNNLACLSSMKEAKEWINNYKIL